VDECKALVAAPPPLTRWCSWCRQGLTLVLISAQLELTLPLSAQRKLTLTPTQPNVTRGCSPKGLKLSSVNDVFAKVLKLSFEVSECKPLGAGPRVARLARAVDAHVTGHRVHVRWRGPPGRGLHSSTFRLNVSALCGIRGPCRGCVGGACVLLGGNRGCVGCISCQKQLRLS